MTASAPWLALSVDWYLSEMFDALPELGINEAATDGEKLAWLCLLCFAKQNGRGGVVVARKSALCRTFQLSERSVSGMMRRAQKCEAIEIDGDTITIKNWRVYQDKAQKGQSRRNTQIGKKRETRKKSATNHQPPTTKDTSPTTEIPLAAGKPPRARTARDDLFDAVSIAAYGVSPPPNGQAARIGKIVTDLTTLGAKPDEFRRRMENARLHFDHPGPEAVVKHWAVCDAPPVARAAPTKPNRRDTEYEQEPRPIRTIAL